MREVYTNVETKFIRQAIITKLNNSSKKTKKQASTSSNNGTGVVAAHPGGGDDLDSEARCSDNDTVYIDPFTND